jgi:probable DNA metabolism protein
MPGIDVILPGPADFPAWRAEARKLLAAQIPPAQAEWRVAGEAGSLFAGAAPPDAVGITRVPRRFVALAETVICHRDPARFALLYAALWRITAGEPTLLETATDPDVIRLEAMAKSVRRDAHKMHAFLRFREVASPDGPRHIAWFEPDQHILAAETGFFIDRFGAMRWSILTPEASAHWDGAALRLGPGGSRRDAPPEDASDDLWRVYYAAIFNPARLKPAAMRAEMPMKYWRNMPEARAIPRLMAEAPRRAAEMVARGATAPAARRQRNTMPTPLLAPLPTPEGGSLDALCRALAARRDLPGWAAQATQPVFGEGPPGAALMFVGEQPGDEEDLAGRPFVGPAGRLFDHALAAVEIDRGRAYVTNAVKHFKFTPLRGRRLHEGPDAGDIAFYRPFLRQEAALVGPKLVVSLGASALRALTGRALAVTAVRGVLARTEDGLPLLPTVHPAYLLRLPDQAAKAREWDRFLADLRVARHAVG